MKIKQIFKGVICHVENYKVIIEDVGSTKEKPRTSSHWCDKKLARPHPLQNIKL